MADIITRLLLKTNDFDANLNKAKGSVNQFQGGIANMAKTAGAGIMKFAGTLGIAVGAYEAFDKTIKSSQTTGDAWVKMQDQMKASVDSFFASLAMGNVDGFLSNLQNVIDKAGDLSVALDNLGTKTLFNNGEVDDLNTKYQIALNKAKARNISDEERNKYLNEARGYLVEITKLQTSLSQANKETSYTALQAEMAKQGFDRNISKDTWEYLLKDSNRADIEARAAEYNNTVGGYKNKLAHPYDPKTGEWITQRDADELEKKLSEYEASKRGNFNRMASIFVQLADDEKSMVKKAIDMRKASNALSVSVSQKELEVANTDAKINGSYKSNNGAGSNKPAPPPVGSLAALDAEITKQNKKLAEATTMQARAAVQATINELEQQKINLKVVVDQEAFKIKHGEMKGNKADDAGYSEQHTMFSDMLAERESALSKATDEQTKTFIQSQIDKLRETINGLNRARYELETPGNIAAKSMPKNVDYETLRGYSNKIEEMKAALSEDVSERTKASIQAEINKLETAARALAKVEGGTPGSIYEALQNNASNKKQGSFDLRKELPNMKLPKFKSPIKKDDVNLNEEYAASLNSIGTAFGSMGQMASQFGEDGLAFALNSVGTIAQMIIQLESLATAQGVASAMALPFPANLGAIATVIGAITSIFSSLPTFETGGIIPGTSFSGDKVLARVNSGEMILNSEQQSNLFKMLNSNLYGGLNIGRPNIEPQTGNIAALIAPGGDNQKIELAGNIRIKAQELELILKNRERITGRIR